MLGYVFYNWQHLLEFAGHPSAICQVGWLAAVSNCHCQFVCFDTRLLTPLARCNEQKMRSPVDGCHYVEIMIWMSADYLLPS